MSEEDSFKSPAKKKQKAAYVSIFDFQVDSNADQRSPEHDYTPYPPEYIEKLKHERTQWKDLFKDLLGAHGKEHVDEVKNAVERDPEYLEEMKRLESIKADFKNYLEKVKLFQYQKIVHERIRSSKA